MFLFCLIYYPALRWHDENRFYGTDLNCSATDLERVAEEQRRIVHDRIKVRTDKQYGFIRHDEGFEC
jgi:hypothetical protein